MKSYTQTCARIRLCARDGIALSEDRLAEPQAQDFISLVSVSRRSNLYTSYTEKTGALPQPEAADTIGRLLGTRVKARDGKSYPQPSERERCAAKQMKEHKKAYHDAAHRMANLKEALALLEALGEPASLAIHTKNDLQIGKALDAALDWLTRFAGEWRSHEQSCC